MLLTRCSPGYFCSGGASSSKPDDGITGDLCPIGFFCEAGSSPSSCEPGTYSNSTGTIACTNCPEGYYCNNTINPTPCPPGYYCPEGTGNDIIPCMPGTYNPQTGASNVLYCLNCAPGMHCQFHGAASVTGNCSKGFYCSSGVDVLEPDGAHLGLGGVCPSGTFCPEGSSFPMPCKDGSYNSLPKQEECTICPEGYFCPSNSSEFLSHPCPVGHYCPNGTRFAFEFPCPSGTYSNNTQGTSVASCLECPPGMYCEGRGLSEPIGNCSAGWYCLRRAVQPTPGYFFNVSSGCIEDATGGSCCLGTYCPPGAAAPVVCPAGMFCASSMLDQPSGSCDAGFWC